MASAIIAIENVNSEGLCQQQKKKSEQIVWFFFFFSIRSSNTFNLLLLPTWPATEE